MDFNIQVRGILQIGNIELMITESMINTWIISGILILFAAVVRAKLKNFKEIPTGFQNVVEYIVEFFDNFVKSTAGERLSYLGNWYFMVFLFIVVSNTSGALLMPLMMRPPTADWAVNFTLACCTLVILHAMSIRYKKRKYFKQYLEPFFIFLPINVISELARPISLSFRLFGNVVSGLIIVSLLYGMAPIFVQFGFPLIAHAFFDLFAGFIQAYVFVIVSMSLIGILSQPSEA